MNWFESILQYFLTPVVISGLVVYVIKKIFDRYFKEKVEIYKHELNLQRIEHEVRYSKLHEKRAGIIDELYKKLVLTEKCLTTLLNPIQWSDEPSEEEKIKSVVKNANDFINYYDENKIYFNPKICELLNKIKNSIHSLWNEYSTGKLFKTEDGDRESYREYYKSRQNAWKAISEDFPPLKTELESEFRGLFGVN